jgi:hypothetical protein
MPDGTKAKMLHRVFDPYRESAADASRIKCSASELLGLYELLRYIVALRVPRVAELQSKLRSFDAACEVLDLIVSAKRGTLPAGSAAVSLRGALKRHMDQHILAYGVGGIRPKHHWNFHIPGQLERDAMVLDTFVIERLHLVVKAVAEPINNTRSSERSLMVAVLNVTTKPAKVSDFANAMLGRVHCAGEGVYIAKKMLVHGWHVEDGDVVCTGDRCGVVRACLLVDGILHTAVDTLEKVGRHTIHWGLWRRTPHHEVWLAAVLVQPIAWKEVADGALLLLR